WAPSVLCSPYPWGAPPQAAYATHPCASRIAHLPLSRCYKVAPEWLYRAVPVCHCHWAGPSYVPSHFAITPLAISGACAALAAPWPDCPGTHLHAPNRKKTAVAQTSL